MIGKCIACMLAGGFGSRLDCDTDGAKALIKVGGRPLVSYVLDALSIAGVNRLIVALRREQVVLQEYLIADPRFTTELVFDRGQGTLPAAENLYKRIRGEAVVLVTADILLSRRSIVDLLHFATTQRNTPLAVLLASSFVCDDEPIWIEAGHHQTIRRLGRELPPTGLVFAHVRWLSSEWTMAIDRLDRSMLRRESHLLAAVCQAFPGAIQFLDAGIVVDIDQQIDIDEAEQLLRKGWLTE